MTEQEFNRNISGMRKKLLHFAGGFSTGGAATPEDMVQEAIMRVWKLNSGTEQVRNLEAMAMTILKNICLDYIKLKKNRSEGMESVGKNEAVADVFCSPHHTLEVKEGMGLVKIFIKMLPADQQVVLRLRDVMGYELGEIAVILDTSEGNVRTMLSRARGKLKCYLTGIK